MLITSPSPRYSENLVPHIEMIVLQPMTKGTNNEKILLFSGLENLNETTSFEEKFVRDALASQSLSRISPFTISEQLNRFLRTNLE